MSKSKGRLKAVYAADTRHALMIGGKTTNTTLYPRCQRLPAHLRPTDSAALRKQGSEYLESERDGRKSGAVPTVCRCAACSDRRGPREVIR